jgi:electron transport complex protein RnfC
MSESSTNIADLPETVSVFRPMPGVLLTPPVRASSTPAETDLAGWIALLRSAAADVHRVASPDLLGQLEQAGKTKIDTIICSVLDTDPSVPFNATVAEAFTREMAVGIDLLAKLTGAGRIWITADPDKPSAWFADMREWIQNLPPRLVPLRGDYPQTDPTLMLYTLLQRRLLPGRLPTEKKAMLLDAAAAVAVGRCVLYEPPLLSTELALRDHFERHTHFLSVPIGVRLGEVCDFLQLHHPEALFRAGDFLRDQWLTRDSQLGNGELVVHPTARHLEANPDPCIHCGWCLEACPTRIHPAGLLDAAQQRNLAVGKRFGLAACIECGICSYVCPTRLPLLTAIRELRKMTNDKLE